MASRPERPPVIGGRRSLQGRKPGDKRVRVERPHAPYFRYTGKGTLTAKEAASAPKTPVGKAFASARGLFFGRPLASEDELGERLSKTKALAIFSSDAISSSAYATEEILRVLILGGAAALAIGRRDQHRDLGPPGRGGHLVPPDLHRLPVGRRLVHRLASEHRSHGQPDRGVGADDRLRHDRGGLDVVRRRAGRLGVPRPARRAGPDRRRGDRAHRHRQPARPARGGQHLRGPHLPVHRLGAPHDRGRRLSHRRPR